jgi:hypothetical protein
MVTKDSPSHLTSETAAQQHMQQTLNRTQVNIPPPKKKQKTKEKQEIQSTNEIANHMGSIQDPKFKDSKKKTLGSWTP